MSLYEDEIDLQKIVNTLFDRKWFIVIFSILFGLIGLVFSLTQTRTYQATATIILTRSQSNLSIADQFPTINEPMDNRSRMETIVAIATNDKIARNVVNLVKDDLNSANLDLVSFKRKTEVTNVGDAILITTSADDPKLASRIANFWASEVIESVNTAYSEDQPLINLEKQLETAEEEYRISQSELESFIQNSQIDLLTSQIDQAKLIFDELASERAKEVLFYENRRESMNQLIVQAQSLQEQIKSGSDSSTGNLGDALSVLTARVQASGFFVDSTQRDSQESANLAGLSGFAIEIQISELSTFEDRPEDLISDLNGIIDLAGIEKNKAETELDMIVNEVILDEVNENIDKIAETIRQLETQLEAEEVKQRDLTNTRDLKEEAYQALVQKFVEIRNETQSRNSINLVSAAIPPEKPEGRGTIKNSFVAGVLGFIIATSWVLGSNWWNSINLSSSDTQTENPTG
jgi:uncharacterized protein involved in exopolysaccharide biosynthesis